MLRTFRRSPCSRLSYRGFSFDQSVRYSEASEDPARGSSLAPVRIAHRSSMRRITGCILDIPHRLCDPVTLPEFQFHGSLPLLAIFTGSNEVFLPGLSRVGFVALQQSHKSIERFPSIAEREIKSVPVFAILSVMVWNDVLKLMGQS